MRVALILLGLQMHKVSLLEELNDFHIKIAKFKGEFAWHQHEQRDELFFVVKGTLLIKLRDQEVYLNSGEFLIVPKGTEHLPIAREEVYVMLIEPKSTLNTGNALHSDYTKAQLGWI